MIKKLLLLFILTMTLNSFKARGATYNFNFYNNEKDEKVIPLKALEASTSPSVIPLAAPTPISSDKMLEEKGDKIKESNFYFGYFHYGSKNRNKDKEPESDFDSYLDSGIFVTNKSGDGLKIGFGKRGGFKAEIEAIKEKGDMRYIQNTITSNSNWPSYAVKKSSVFTLYGAGLNLKKEFNFSSALALELGIGGQYYKGNRVGKREGEDNYKVEDYRYHGQIGFNLYYDKLSLNLSGRLGQNKISTRVDTAVFRGHEPITNTISEYEIKSSVRTSAALIIGLTYHM